MTILAAAIGGVLLVVFIAVAVADFIANGSPEVELTHRMHAGSSSCRHCQKAKSSVSEAF